MWQSDINNWRVRLHCGEGWRLERCSRRRGQRHRMIAREQAFSEGKTGHEQSSQVGRVFWIMLGVQ